MLENMSTIAFCHHHHGDNRFTIAYARKNIDGVVYPIISFAICHITDQYNKKIGRAISSGRLKQKPITITGMEDFTNNDIIQQGISLIDKYGIRVLDINTYDLDAGILS